MTDSDTRLVTLESELAEAKRQLAERVMRSASEQRVIDAAIAWAESSDEDDADYEEQQSRIDALAYALVDAVEALVAVQSPPAIHIVQAGYPLCQFTSLLPGAWPAGHSWVRLEEAKDATCADCIAARSR